MGLYEDTTSQIQGMINEFNDGKVEFDKRLEEFEKEKELLTKQKKDLEQLARERQIGFPTLGEAYKDYFDLQDRNLVDFLKFKNNPAVKAGDLVDKYAKIRREALKDKKVAEYLVKFYEDIAPFLLDLKEEVELPTEEDLKNLQAYTEEEKHDEVSNFVSKDEYRKLSVTEKNQLALDRFWKRPKSKWYIGRLYERYVGYLYEEQGYDVEYHGIEKGFEDLGRDLICRKGKEIVVIQCKNWSHFKRIRENAIFQFFGTVFQFRDANPGKKVEAVFYTTTELSDVAYRFAQELKITLKDKCKFDIQYPSIKCNISKVNGEKIYHLPFDQQYETVKIEKKTGEFYCATVAEAEKAGFRRAFKWNNPDKKN